MAEQTDKKPAEQETLGFAEMKQMAHDYAVPMSEGTLKDLAKDMTPEKAKAFEQYLSTAAQGLYPTLAPQIKAGIKTAYLLDPYRQVAKQLVGDQYEPDFVGNSHDAAALSGGSDPATGRPAPMSLDQWKGHVKTNPAFGWQHTPDAQNHIESVLQGMQQAMDTPVQGVQ